MQNNQNEPQTPSKEELAALAAKIIKDIMENPANRAVFERLRDK